MPIECRFIFDSNIQLQSKSNNEIGGFVDCSSGPCLYHSTSNQTSQLVVLGQLDNPEQQCDEQKSNGLELELSTVSCTLNTLPYLQNVEYYQNSQCKRQKCKCKPGFSNKGWQCAAGVTEKSASFRLDQPMRIIIDDYSDKWLNLIETTIKESMVGSKLVIGEISLDFVDFIMFDHICFSCSSQLRRQISEGTGDFSVYSDVVYKYECEFQNCDNLKEDYEAKLSEPDSTVLTTFSLQLDAAAKNVEINGSITVPPLQFLIGDSEKDNLMQKITERKLSLLSDQAEKEKLIEEQAAIRNEGILNILDDGKGQTENNVDLDVAEVEAEEEALTNLISLTSLFVPIETVDDFDEAQTVDEKKTNEEPEEEKILQNFASLTPAELEKSFGSFKPVSSLNPYMAKLDPCQVITINQTGTVMSYIQHKRVFRIASFDIKDCTGELETTCLELSLIVHPNMKSTLQMKISRESVFVNIELNRNRWTSYLNGDYSDQDWGKKPTSQFQIKLMKRKVIANEKVEIQQGIINIIVPQLEKCDLSVKSSDAAEIKNFYRELFVIPPVNPWGSHVLGKGVFRDCRSCGDCKLYDKPPLFQCDIKSTFAKAVNRVVGIIDAVQTTEVNNIRQVPCEEQYKQLKQWLIKQVDFDNITAVDQYIDSKLIANDKTFPNCFIVEYAIQVKVNEKLVNGKSLEKSLDTSSVILEEEILYLMTEAPRIRV